MTAPDEPDDTEGEALSTVQAVLDTDTGLTFATGWVDDPGEVAAAVAAMGCGRLSAAAPALFAYYADDDAPKFFWEAEAKVRGAVLPSWNQGAVGSCVSFGFGRAVQDLMYLEIVAGEREHYPAADVATEPIYGGSRVEVGGGRIRGDGSVGAWAAKWVKDWGVVIRKVYRLGGETHDLTAYSEPRCRLYGSQGCPDALEPEARLHPVTDVALVRSGDELWAALGAGKPTPVCSTQGFTTTLREGFCEPSGTWAHCMEFRGRFKHPGKGKCVVVQNSWGGYLRGARAFEYVAADGSVKQGTLPEGCFCTTLSVAARMCARGDTFALAGLTGWDVPAPTPPVVPPVPVPPPAPLPPKAVTVPVPAGATSVTLTFG